MDFNSARSCHRLGRRQYPPESQAPAARFRSASARGAAVVLIAVVCVVTAGSAATGRKKPAAPEKIDAKALSTLVQHFDKVELEKHPWGWIRWLMNSKLDPKSPMTFGVVEINAGQTNPLHVHPNGEELIYVLSGSCEHRIGDQTVVLKAGDLLRIPAGVPHTAKTSQKEPVRAVVVYNTGNRQFETVGEKGP